MNETDRHKLRFGPYHTPRHRIGATVVCEICGEVVIVGTSDGRIPWPLGRPAGAKGRASLVVYRDLAKAVRKESKQAVRHWWGAGHIAVSKWRVALDVPLSNEGTSQLRTAYSQEEWAVEAPGRKRGRKVATRNDARRSRRRSAARSGRPD